MSFNIKTFFQHEAKMKSLVDYMRGVENKKRSLEDEVDQLNEDIARLKAAEPASILLQDSDNAQEQVSLLLSIGLP